MRTKIYQVIEAFDPKKDYGVHFAQRFKISLNTFQKGEEFRTRDIVNKLPKSNQTYAYDTITLGTRLGLFKLLDNTPIEFKDFCDLETVSYFSQQLRDCKFKHKQVSSKAQSTKQLYLYKLWNFNNWLVGRKFKFRRQIRTGIDTLKEVDELIELHNVEEFLKLYQEPHTSNTEFVRIIKSFLMDDMHQDKKASTVDLFYCSIRAYFDRNDSPINFKFDSTVKYDQVIEDEEKPEISLEDLLKMLTVGRPSILEKAVIICKFQRGLDNSTMVDRFNFQVWEQLVEWFGTSEYQSWDESRCPVPIKLTRIKNSFSHTGFLDIDAINSIQDYLKFRYKQTGEIMKKGDALFLNRHGNPIHDLWVGKLVRSLAKKAGIQSIIKSYKASVRYKQNSHELRDLLKSTLIDSGTRLDISDHVIGHKPKDSYEKQNTLYPASLRAEYMKASKRLNMFSNISHYMNGDDEKEILRKQVSDFKITLEKSELSSSSELQSIKVNQDKIMAWIQRQENKKIEA